MAKRDILVAKTSAVFDLDGKRVAIRKGVTTARADHPIVRGREHMWEPLRVHFDAPVEQATAEPGEKRQVKPTVGKTRTSGQESGSDSD